jgi:hypothetical protein
MFNFDAAILKLIVGFPSRYGSVPGDIHLVVNTTRWYCVVLIFDYLGHSIVRLALISRPVKRECSLWLKVA